MAEAASTQPLAIVGMACRYPDADDPAALLDVALTGRRVFRRLPPTRLKLADYYRPDLATTDATYSTRAALIEGWRFDWAAYRIDSRKYEDTDPAHWLALETTTRALDAAGLACGGGMNRDRTGIFIGNTLAGEVSRANALRLRWPYVRQVLTEALDMGKIPASQAGTVLARAESRYLAPFPATSADSLAGSQPGTIAAGISAYFGFRGGGHTIDSTCSSSLQAVVSACAALAAGDLDVALAGGVDISLDPLELIGLAKAGVLATADVRIYDQDPTGYLPGEGCGMLVLMRAADARSAGLPVLAEVAGWGVSAGAVPGDQGSLADSHLLAMRRAYERAAVDPGEIQLVEGNGSGTQPEDTAELAALAAIRRGAATPAVLGSVKANIGHTQAAAGVAGLIKAVQAANSGVLPPTTGAHRPHVLIAEGGARLELPSAPREWPDGTRLAAVSTMGVGASSVHLVLRHEPDSGSRRSSRPSPAPLTHGNEDPGQPDAAVYRVPTAPEPLPFLLHAHDRFALAALLTRLADTAIWLSDAQLQDLACALGRDPGQQGRTRVAIVAARQEQLALLAREAVTLLPHLEKGRMSVRPGIFASDLADGRVTLLLSPGADEAVTDTVARCLSTVRWLESLDVQASRAVGHGAATLAGLAWSGVLGQADVCDIAGLRSKYLLDSASRGQAGAAAHPDAGRDDSFHDAIAKRFRFGPPRRCLLSTASGTEVESAAAAIDLLCSGFSPSDELARAVAAGAAGATLLLETGPGKTLTTAAADLTSVPAVSLQDGFADPMSRARASAALFAAGALGRPAELFEGMPARPIDVWRRQIFIANPCGAAEQPARASASRPALRAGLVEHQGAAGDGDRAVSDLRSTFEHRISRPADTPAPDARVPHEADDPGGRAGARGRPLPWVRCFAEELRRCELEPGTDAGLGWRINAAFRSPLLRHAGEVFTANADADRTLAVLASPADPDSRATAVRAARDAMATGSLVVLTTSAGFTGFFASLHAEQPSAGMTVLRLTDGSDADLAAAVRMAGRFARTEPGVFRELVVCPDGTAREPVMSALALTGRGAFPLAPDDVVLISRATAGAGLALAQVLACCGNPVAVVGRGSASDDTELVAGLEELRSAGARVGYEVIDLTDAASLAAAVERIQDRLGPVSAIAHAASPGGHVPLENLTDVQVSDYLASEVAVLDQLAGSVRADELKLIVTFGSVAGRYGQAGRSLHALGTAALASRASQLATAAAAAPRTLHVDMPPWSVQHLGEPGELSADLVAAGTPSTTIDTAARLLLKALATPGLPESLAIHGRARGPAINPARPLGTAELTAAGLPDGARFLREVTSHYPGAELVCEAVLSLTTDPYLADYRIDGLPVLPEVLAVEALAQAASVLAGRPLRQARQVTMPLPVAVPTGSEARVRICAQREGDAVIAVLRCADSSFAVDHVRAEFVVPADDGNEAGEQPQLDQLAPLDAASPVGLVDGTELYGPLCFQSGRFRRVALFPEVTARSCRALARGGDDQQWFATSEGAFLLGSPGLNDATVHAVQACVPHRRLRPAGCESVAFSGRTVNGVVEIRAAALAQAPAGPPPTAPQLAAMIPAQAAPADADPPGQAEVNGAATASGREARKQRRADRSQPDSGQAQTQGDNGQAAVPESGPLSPAPLAGDQLVWDVTACDATGRVLVAWHKLRLTDAGPLPRNAAWPPSLLSVFLEHSAAALGLADGLRVTVTCGQPPQSLTAVPQSALGQYLPGGATPRNPPKDNVSMAVTVGDGPLAGFGLALAAAVPVACAWTAVPVSHWPAQPAAGLAAAYAQLRDELAEAPGVLTARLQTVTACLASAGLRATDVELTRTTADGWALLQTPEAMVGCVVVEMSGVPTQVAIALLAGRHTGPVPMATPRGMAKVRAGLSH